MQLGESAAVPNRQHKLQQLRSEQLQCQQGTVLAMKAMTMVMVRAVAVAAGCGATARMGVSSWRP